MLAFRVSRRFVAYPPKAVHLDSLNGGVSSKSERGKTLGTQNPEGNLVGRSEYMSRLDLFGTVGLRLETTARNKLARR